MVAETGLHNVTCNGLTFRVRVDGRPDAPWLLLSNSLMTDLTLWDAQVAAFGDRFRILRYDQRGHGGTDLSPAPFTFDDLVADAAGLLDAFEIATATVVGVSMGAATALGLAGLHPGRVSMVVASDGQAKTAPGGAQAWQERIDIARTKGMGAVIDASLPRWFRPGFLAMETADLARAKRMMAGTTLDGYVAGATALKSYDFDALLPQLRQPVLLIAGADDGAIPATMRGMQRSIPNACFVDIPDAGHLPNLERPDAFNTAVSAFLDGAA